MERKEEIISKILKLMEMGNVENNDNPYEREVASRKVAQLMADWAIEFADLRRNKPNKSDISTNKVKAAMPFSEAQEGILANIIGKSFDCRVIRTYYGEDRSYIGEHIAFVGEKHDLEIAVYFFKHLRRTMLQMARKKVTEENVRRTSRSKANDLRIARKNYCIGFVTTVNVRMEELYLKREEFVPAESKALIVVKTDEVDKFFREKFPNCQKVRSTQLTGDLNAYYNGKEDGRLVNLSRPISSGERAYAGQIGG